MKNLLPELSDEEKARYEWQMWTPDAGEEAQRRLKAASVLVSRIGGVGGTAAMYLAAAGVGRLILAHAGNVEPSDLNRQMLMTTDWIGKPRTESAVQRLRELNPNCDVVAIPENLCPDNASQIISQADMIVDAAPLFAERFAMNREAIRQRKPLVECAMFDMNVQVMTLIPGSSACLRCLYPEDPPFWKRQFPVFGAVSGLAGTLAAVEVIKLITEIGTPLTGQLLTADLRTMAFRRLPLLRNPACTECLATP